jgi:hypothetical protein
MTTAGTIVDRCFRENNLLAIGKTPSAAQAAEALTYLNSLIKSMLGTDEGELLLDWPVPYAGTKNSRWPLYPQNPANPSYVYDGPPANVRLLISTAEPFTVYFPNTPPDGARMALVNVATDFTTYPVTLSGNGRLIEGAQSLLLDTNPTGPLLWLYRADLANWIELAFPLAATDEVPFPDSFDDFWCALLAVRIAPIYGKEPNVITAGIAQNGMKQFKARYAQEVPTANFPDAAVFNSYQSFGGPGWEPWG